MYSKINRKSPWARPAQPAIIVYMYLTTSGGLNPQMTLSQMMASGLSHKMLTANGLNRKFLTADCKVNVCIAYY